MLPKANSVLKVMEGAKNNLPDLNAQNAASCIADLVSNLDNSAILFVTISGGGSALLPSPMPPISLSDKLAVTKLLSSAGASIQELNAVRKSLSMLKGGGLAMLAYPAKVIALILSDVVDDPLDIIASGPTVYNTDSKFLALHILNKYSLETKVPQVVLNQLKGPLSSNTMSVEVPVVNGQFSHVCNYVIGNNGVALENIAEQAKNAGYVPLILSSALEGNARKVAKLYSSFAVEICRFICGEITGESLLANLNNACHTQSIPLKNFNAVTQADFPYECRRFCLISGGETTVEVKGSGLGGRNQELALAFSLEVSDLMKKYPCCEMCNILLLSGGTDGIDGPTTYAGAISYPQQISFSKSRGIDPLTYLNNNDSTNFYLNINNGEDLLEIGHTGTNVMDIHILIVEISEK
ncbi:glycerate kinase isoform X2 [Hetaerina americana]